MPEQRTSRRVPLSVECTLRRRSGSPITSRTLDLGTGGMRVRCERPLAPDEVLHFDLPLAPGEVVAGQARVLREQTYGVYALRFEALREPARAALAGVAS